MTIITGTGFVSDATGGRKAGSLDRSYETKQAVINKGVEIAKERNSFVEAATAIRDEYPRRNVTVKYLAKLIRNASKVAD